MNYNKVVVPKKGSRKGVQKKDGVIVNYHGPYMDSSGEKFYLPRKWTLCPTTSDDGKAQRRHKECGINYSFKPDEMKGGDLMKNLWWLGQFGRLRTLLDRDADEVNDECGDNDNDDEDAEEVQQRSGDLIGGGPPRKCQRHNDTSYKFEEERNIRRAMPKMEGMLGNWMLHGQNLEQCLKTTKDNTDTYPQTIEENSVNSSIPPQQCWTP